MSVNNYLISFQTLPLMLVCLVVAAMFSLVKAEPEPEPHRWGGYRRGGYGRGGYGRGGYGGGYGRGGYGRGGYGGGRRGGHWG